LLLTGKIEFYQEMNSKRLYIRTFVCFFFALFLLAQETAIPQISGLGFNSYGVTKDLRTGIDLFPEKPLTVKDNFELSFSFRLRKAEKQYFGYVFRLITEDKNIDLILNHDGPEITYFTLVDGQKLLARVNSDFDNLCNWNIIDFKFSASDKSVTLTLSDTTFQISDVGINKGSRLSLYFGLCNVGNFKTTDVPPIYLRDIKIKEQDRLTHYWPLDEMSGQTALDAEGGMSAMIINPLWLKSEHFNWKEVYSEESDGYSWCTFDQGRDEVIIIKSKDIVRYSVVSGQRTEITPKNPNANILNSRQAVYDPEADIVYLLDIDKPSVAGFDFKSQLWTGDLLAGLIESDFTHYNKYYSATDTSIYFFGGYGHHKYKNLVQKYSIRTGNLVRLQTGGDIFNPRYLAGLGEISDTIYIMGGFGSDSGEQILNPHSYFDLMTFSLKNHSFRKKFEITPPPTDHAFSNSIIINPADRSFYALIFPVFNYDGYLQLIKGSLDSPDYKQLGSRIPYQFLDVASFSDLYLSRQTNKLVAVTIKNEEGKSQVKIFTLGFPPDQQPGTITVAGSENHILLYLLTGFFVVVLILSALFLLRRRKKPQQNHEEKVSQPTISPEPGKKSKGSVSYLNFFGDFQVISCNGEDITRKFTPLLKELFLLIWMNSIKNDIGISNEKIIETLWHDFSDTSAQNNKAVNIAKLRVILSENFSCSLTYKNTGYWRIDYKNTNVVNDYYEFLKITSGKGDLYKPDLLKLVDFSHKGQFLANLKYSWLEEYKVSVSNEMITRLVKFLRSLSLKDEPDTVIRISDAIMTFDNLNEEALENKCKVLVSLGRHAVAKEVYDQFVRDYKTLYFREYEKSFTSIASTR
jgi:two-component SAPR family response regulator